MSEVLLFVRFQFLLLYSLFLIAYVSHFTKKVLFSYTYGVTHKRKILHYEFDYYSTQSHICMMRKRLKSTVTGGVQTQTQHMGEIEKDSDHLSPLMASNGQ